MATKVKILGVPRLPPEGSLGTGKRATVPKIWRAVPIFFSACKWGVSNKFFGMRDFPYLRLGIRDFKAKSGRDSGLKVCAGGVVRNITLGITGLPEILGRDYGI